MYSFRFQHYNPFVLLLFYQDVHIVISTRYSIYIYCKLVRSAHNEIFKFLYNLVVFFANDLERLSNVSETLKIDIILNLSGTNANTNVYISAQF